MKIFLTLTLTILFSNSVFSAQPAACTAGEACSAENCKALGTGYSLNPAGKCVQVATTQKDSICPEQNQGNRVVAPPAKDAPKDAPKEAPANKTN